MADDLRNPDVAQPATLEVLGTSDKIVPSIPVKRINDGQDLTFFLRTKAYADIMTFLLQLNRAMVPEQSERETSVVQTWPIGKSAIDLSPQVTKVRDLIQSLGLLMKDAPPETGPRRFGNAAFRTWYKLVQKETPGLLKEALSHSVWDHVTGENDREILEKELESYLLGSFGSSERLDYGTGHELSFLAFLGGIWKLGGFASATQGEEERGIVIGIIQPYLELVRSLILTYTLEPAGSHGVWGLDDHSFLPYILGSAQYCPPTKPGVSLPTVGSLKGAPSPDRTAKLDSVEIYRSSNLYFSAIGFIFDVKRGPFWEHSPTLYDISGIKDGWAKINKGMIKMYNAEVLSKFPVVQHLYFGTLFNWEAHPMAVAQVPSPHVNAQPDKGTMPESGMARPSGRVPSNGSAGAAQSMAGTAAPWAKTGSGIQSTTSRAMFSQADGNVAHPTRNPARYPPR